MGSRDAGSLSLSVRRATLDPVLSVCEIVQTGTSHRLPMTHGQVDVVCPGCGNAFTTSKRNHHRIVTGEIEGLCGECRRPRPTLCVTETHRRYWLIHFGCDLQGRTAAEYVRQEGLPRELVNLCEAVSGLFDRIGVAA